VSAAPPNRRSVVMGVAGQSSLRGESSIWVTFSPTNPGGFGHVRNRAGPRRELLHTPVVTCDYQQAPALGQPAPSSLSPAFPATRAPRLPPSTATPPERPWRFAVALREAADASGFLGAFLRSQQQAEPWPAPSRAARWPSIAYRVRFFPRHRSPPEGASVLASDSW